MTQAMTHTELISDAVPYSKTVPHKNVPALIFVTLAIKPFWEVRLQFIQHPLEQGQVFQSLGGHFTYRVVGPCCRLFDREELPWPCCRIQWRSKEPSWRRVGKRFVLDLATKNSPSYSVEVLGQESSGRAFVVTLYAVKLPQPLKEWWYTQRPHQATDLPPIRVSASVI